MCLRINSAPKVADEDIFCYKILEECPHGWWRGYTYTYTYRSPFQEIPIKDEIVRGLCPYVGDGYRAIQLDSFGHPIISEGYIHTYKYKIVAENMVEYFQNGFENDCHLFECKIPKGTEYYEGYDGNVRQGYASEKIVFVRKLL